MLRNARKAGGVGMAAKPKAKKQLAALPDGRIEAVSTADAEALSTIKAVAKLHVDGLGKADIAMALGITSYKVQKALDDPRMRLAVGRIRAEIAGETALTDAIAVAQAEYRLARAWEVLDMELDASDPWIRHQAALAVIAAAAKASESGGGTELVIAPELAFDDQDLQDASDDGADSGDLMVIDAD